MFDRKKLTNVQSRNRQGSHVIIVTKLDGAPVLINLDTVKFVESVPDTVITFLNGDSLIVKESVEEIFCKYKHLQKEIFCTESKQD